MRRAVQWGLGLVVVVLAIGVGGWLIAGMRGESQIERWVAGYLKSVVGEHINAELHIGMLDYQAPKTVTVQEMSLRAGDTDLLTIKEATLVLAEIPSVGQPILIERFDLIGPRFHFVRDDTGGLAGWSGLLKQEVAADSEAVPSGKRASDFLRLRQARIQDAGFTYVSGAGQPPMDVGGLSMEMGAQPEGGGAIYDLSGTCDWKGLFKLELDAGFDIDASVFEIASLKLRGDLSDESYALFPPQVQELLRQYAVEGHVSGALKGTLPISTPELAALEGSVALKDTGATIENKTIRIDEGALKLSVGDGQAMLNAKFDTLDGQVAVDATAGVAVPQKFTVDVTCDGVELARMTPAAEGQTPELAGVVAAKIHAMGAAATLPDSLAGEGEVTVRKGYLMRLPVLGKLQDVILAGRDLPAWQRNDSANAKFTIGPQAIELSEFEVASMVLAARGSGTVTYEGMLDLLVNAGPLQKLAGALGKVGDALNKVADSVVVYQVTGPIAEPQIEVKPLKGLKGLSSLKGKDSKDSE